MQKLYIDDRFHHLNTNYKSSDIGNVECLTLAEKVVIKDGLPVRTGARQFGAEQQ